MAASSSGKTLSQVITVVGFITLVAQFVLIIQFRVASIPETILRFFCYFTIITNILVTITSFFQWSNSGTRVSNFFRKPSTKAAVAVYILVVAIVYNLTLRGLVKLSGANMMVNELLHVIIPSLYLIYWIFFAEKKGIQWRNLWGWLVYPFVYLVMVMIVGSLLNSRFYPYPFLDAYNHGYQKVFYGVLAVMGLFIILSLLFILFARSIENKSKQTFAGTD